ncbi:MAG: hybrid sensor histidine kinase/response regulator [Bacteroidales bacterium]
MMDKDQENFLNELLNDFRIEASEHYQAIVNGLLILEKNVDTSVLKSTIENIFREVHSLKGAARAVNLLDIEKLCMSMENIFNSLKKGDISLFPPMFDAFYKATDLLNILLIDVNQSKKNSGNYNLSQILRNLEFVHLNSIKKNVENNEAELQNYSDNINIQTINDSETFIPRNQDLTNRTLALDENDNDESAKLPLNESQTVRISIAKLNSLLQQSEELLSIKTTYEYFTKELQSINFQYSLRNKKAYEKISNSEQNLYEFLISEKEFRKKHEDKLYQLNKEMLRFQRIANKMIDELLIDTKTTLLFPFSSMLGIFPKIVRDLSKEYSKDIEIFIIGDNIEIDRRILEEIKDPLIHLIRNCIDHGIENTKDRELKGKPSKGKIIIKIVQDIDRKIVLYIKDDGAGIDKTKIINSALKLGILKPGEIEKLSDKDIYSLIFSSGISSSPFITDISGRGLGMAIVAEKVNKLGGNIELNTVKDEGTTFIISLPQMLSTFRGVLIEIAEQYFIIPSSAIEKVIRIQYSDIRTVESKDTICYNNETIALALMSDVLQISALKKKKNVDEYLNLLILNVSQKKIAFIVDQILGEQEGIVKDLGLQLSHVNNIAGATILGNGKVVPILHPSELLDSSSNSSLSMNALIENIPLSENQDRKNILVVEDSITIRTLLRNFIENAGFQVKTAVDGLEGYNFIQNESFDLVVTDVEMPRMNGFELTSKIREDKRHADLPIILVTALETSEDKQRGMDVGANAYIVKSNFDKSNLIETIQRLI